MAAPTALLAALLLLVGAGVGADAYVTHVAEEEASERVGAELGAPADVDLRGWPVSLRLLAGQVPEVAMSARGVPLEGGARLARLDVVVSDVRVRLADLRGGGSLPVEGGSGRFEADLTQESVNLLAGSVPGEVVLGEGLAAIDVAGQRVDAAVTVDGDGRVVLRPITDAPGVGPVALPLPRLPGEVVVERVRVSPGVLTLLGRVTRLTR